MPKKIARIFKGAEGPLPKRYKSMSKKKVFSPKKTSFALSKNNEEEVQSTEGEKDEREIEKEKGDGDGNSPIEPRASPLNIEVGLKLKVGSLKYFISNSHKK